MTVERFGTVTCARKNQVIGLALAIPRAKLKSKETLIRKKQDIYRKEMAKTRSLGIDNKDHRWKSTFKLHLHLVYV